MSARPPLALARPYAAEPGNGPGRVRVVLAEDHAGIRSSLRGLLAGESDITVVAEAPDAAMAIAHVHGCHPQVLAFDMRMPSARRVELIHHVRTQAPHTNVVVITMQQGRAFADQAHEAGALGYVLKDTADDELAEAVRRAARDQAFTSPRVTPATVPAR
jgi:two-component system, NarL family, response regulator NreC